MCPGYVTVYCDLHTLGAQNPITILHHNLPSATAVSGYEQPGSWSKFLYYDGVTTAQIAALKAVSWKCEQQVTWSCLYSDIRASHLVMGNQTKVDFTQGLDVGCGCPLEDVCKNHNRYSLCTCSNSSVPQGSDNGTILHKSLLPVHAVYVGDTGNAGESVEVTVSPLRCYQSRNVVDTCQSNPCQNGAICWNKGYDYVCNCTQGFRGIHCTEEINECESNPCQHGGVCADERGRYSCSCQLGYTGYNCESEILECASKPCQNQGSCVEQVQGYACICKAGYMGTLCENEINECRSDPCSNGGTCQDLVGEYMCFCPVPFTGPRCETKVNECGSSSCLHGATCIEGLGTYTCTCAPGFTGLQCQTDIDECASNPCRNNATCHDRVNGYFCACVIGFTGKTCEQDVEDCRDGLCDNGGTCHDLVNAYSCSCVSGYSGPHCEIDINECASSPCGDQGVCHDMPGGFTCHCDPGYEGPLCQSEINECLSNPCNTGSTCTDLSNGYTCTCASGFGGPTCHMVQVNGAWGEWSQWSNCSSQCGIGARTRGRQCDTPAPQYGGKPCEGDSAQITVCTGADCVNVDGKWSGWQTWGPCSATCGHGERRRQRACTNPAPRGPGLPCKGLDYMVESCHVHLCGLPVNGGWTVWGPWGNCSTECGVGTRKRHRACAQPMPAYGGRGCDGGDTDTRPCIAAVCPEFKDCGAWSAWGPCDRTCGAGQKSRHRTCFRSLISEDKREANSSALTLHGASRPHRHEHHTVYCHENPCAAFSCMQCHAHQKGDASMVDCTGPYRTCRENEPYCGHVFHRNKTDAFVSKTCLSREMCYKTTKAISNLWRNSAVDSVVSFEEVSDDHLQPSRDTIIELWLHLQGTCIICCHHTGCNRNMLPPRSSLTSGVLRTLQNDFYLMLSTIGILWWYLACHLQNQ